MAGTMDQATNQLLQGANTAGNVYGAWWNPFQRRTNAVSNFGQSLVPAKNGELSPYAQAAYEQEKRNIDRNAADAVGTGIRTLASRGLGTGPSGELSSLVNSTGREAGAEKTNAYENAMQETPGLGLQGAGLMENEQQLANPLAPMGIGINAATNAANAGIGKASMPTPLGQIGAFLAGNAQAFNNVAGGMKSLGMV